MDVPEGASELVIERVVVAAVSFFAAVVTCACIAAGIVYVAADALTMQFWEVFAYWAAGFVVVATGVGFFTSPRSAAEFWGAVWGTNDEERERTHMFLTWVFGAFLIVVLAWRWLR